VGVIGIAGIQQVGGAFTTLATGTNLPTGATSGNELSGVFSVQIASVVAGCAGVCVTFTSSTAGLAADVSTVTGGAVVITSVAGETARFWEDPSNNFTTAGTRATVFGSAVNGTAYFNFGFGTGSFWDSSNSTAGLTGAGSLAGDFNLGQVQIAGGTAPSFAPETCQDTIGPVTGSVPGQNVCGSGHLVGSANPANFLSGDQTDLTVVTAPAQVPEPSSVLLIGSGLLGLGIARWRARKPTK